MKHLLVTNDFPPKVGGIQSLLYELWSRLPPASFAVLTTPHKDAKKFDSRQDFLIRRVREPVLLPHPFMKRRIDAMARELGAELVVIDPAFPLGIIGPWLDIPYGVLIHGAELVVPGRIPGSRQMVRRVLGHATKIIASGTYPAREAKKFVGQDVVVEVITPGVDLKRFRPLDEESRLDSRKKFAVSPDSKLIVGVSRLVPRKGFDILIRAVAHLSSEMPDLRLLIGGSGRDKPRLERMIRELRAPVTLLGRVDEQDLPFLYGVADVCAMICRSRWAGLEQEGFGIVFTEAAACGVPQVAGRSGGSTDAVSDNETGIIVQDPTNLDEVMSALRRLLHDQDLRSAMGKESRARVLRDFDYDQLALNLGDVLEVSQQ